MTQDDRRPFWPTRQEAAALGWAVLLFLFMLAAIVVPLVPLALLVWLPEGDTGWLFALRVGIVAVYVLTYRVWIDRMVVVARRVFTGRISPAIDDWLRHEEPPPVGAWQALRANAHLGVFVVLGLVVALGLLEIRSPLLATHDAPRKFRRLVAVARWCQGNPNTVRASALVAGLGSLALLGLRVRAAARRRGEVS